MENGLSFLFESGKTNSDLLVYFALVVGLSESNAGSDGSKGLLRCHIWQLAKYQNCDVES
jgi:hypothetical protein